MLRLKRAKRVRVHLMEGPGQPVHYVEGLLAAKRGRELAILMPELTVAVGADPIKPEGRLFLIPRERVIAWEEL